jgi:hypothetical protein
MRLAFCGEAAGTVSHEIFIEQPTIMLARPGQPADAHAPASDAVATALSSVLNQRATEITLTGGQLVISFETGLTLKVNPDQRYESWQISSDDGLLIVCTPGGDPPSGIHPAAHNPAPSTRQPGQHPRRLLEPDHLTKPIMPQPGRIRPPAG